MGSFPRCHRQPAGRPLSRKLSTSTQAAYSWIKKTDRTHLLRISGSGGLQCGCQVETLTGMCGVLGVVPFGVHVGIHFGEC